MKKDFQQLVDCIQQHNAPEPFSGVVYLTRGEEVLFEMCSGYAIRSEGIPNQTGTRFQMASGCKIFTSLAICQLVERGKLTFDTHLNDCVNVKFPQYAPEISVKHLLTHTSGITSYFEEDINPDYEALWAELPLYKVRRPGDFLPLFQHKPMKFRPGERFDYNDGGYILLGLVVEATSGMDFPTYIQERVFEPANMRDSGYFATDQLPERTAYAYIQNPDGSWRTNFFAVPIVGAPDGGAYTSAPDMDRFWKALMGDELLTAEMREMMLKAHIPTGWEWPTHYGYGVWIEERDGQVCKYFVEGADPGVALRSVVYPLEGLQLTVLGNTGDALWNLYPKIEQILRL